MNGANVTHCKNILTYYQTTAQARIFCAAGARKICGSLEKLIIFLIQVINLFFCKFPFAKHLTVNIPQLNCIADSADESFFLNIYDLAGLCATYRLSFLCIFTNSNILLLRNYHNEIRQYRQTLIFFLVKATKLKISCLCRLASFYLYNDARDEYVSRLPFACVQSNLGECNLC